MQKDSGATDQVTQINLLELFSQNKVKTTGGLVVQMHTRQPSQFDPGRGPSLHAITLSLPLLSLSITSKMPKITK